MSRLLHRVAFTASRALGHASDPRPFSGLFLTSASPPAAGHLGLARARPALRDLDGLLTREAFLLDATHVLVAAALHDKPHSGPSAPPLSELLGRTEEADRWLASDAEHQCLQEDISFQLALVTATLGGAPGAVASSQGRVASAAFRLIDECVRDGGMSAFQIIVTGLLKHTAVKRRCKDLALKRDEWMFRAVADAINLSGAPRKFGPFFVVQAQQALLPAVVLRALRVVGRDLACAVGERNAAPAVADLRLVQAFLAARGGYFEDALATYMEAARDDASDPRPRYLAHQLCVLAGWPHEADKGSAACNRFAVGSSLDEQVALATLMDELAIAVALGGSALAFDDDERFPVVMHKIVGADGSRVDAALVSALRDKIMPLAARMEARAAPLKELKSKIDGAKD
uniref:Uncharacterized protein n=1 Tax=Setaria viridis TaxID=4556 RepID=A0A4U6UFD8_SETVI|nr:hypothetical protein SEVIR_5G189500v2 [Setaria viridis]